EPCGRTVRQVVSNRDTIKPKLSRETDLFYMLRKALGHRFGGAVLGTNKQRKPHYRPHTAIERGQIACAHNFIEDSRFRFQPQLEGFASTDASIGCSGDSSASLRAMNMSVTQFVQARAIVARSRSVWHEIIDTVVERPPRTTADEIAEYLARHQYDLSPTLRIELERRHVCV